MIWGDAIIGLILFSSAFGLLGSAPPAQRWLQQSCPHGSGGACTAALYVRRVVLHFSWRLLSVLLLEVSFFYPSSQNLSARALPAIYLTLSDVALLPVLQLRSRTLASTKKNRSSRGAFTSQQAYTNAA
jgi:hypothetical protein